MPVFQRGSLLDCCKAGKMKWCSWATPGKIMSYTCYLCLGRSRRLDGHSTLSSVIRHSRRPGTLVINWVEEICVQSCIWWKLSKNVIFSWLRGLIKMLCALVLNNCNRAHKFDLWGPEEPSKQDRWLQKGINTLKNHLCSSCVLKRSSFNQRVLVQVDAFWPALERSWLKDSLYLSHMLSATGDHSMFEMEVLIIKWVLDSLSYYFWGRDFDLETDHQALTWGMRDHESRFIDGTFTASVQVHYLTMMVEGIPLQVAATNCCRIVLILFP